MLFFHFLATPFAFPVSFVLDLECVSSLSQSTTCSTLPFIATSTWMCLPNMTLLLTGHGGGEFHKYKNDDILLPSFLRFDSPENPPMFLAIFLVALTLPWCSALDVPPVAIQCEDDEQFRVKRACLRARDKGDEWFRGDYSDVDEVWPRVFISNICFAGDAPRMKATGITHIVPAAREWGPLFSDEFAYFEETSPLRDEDDADLDYWLRAAAFMDKVLSSDTDARVLVHCNMGGSRSSAAVMIYLMMYYPLSQNDALNVLSRGRPFAKPNQFYMTRLADLHPQAYSPMSSYSM